MSEQFDKNMKKNKTHYIYNLAVNAGCFQAFCENITLYS